LLRSIVPAVLALGVFFFGLVTPQAAKALTLERELSEINARTEERRPVFLSGEKASGRSDIETTLEGNALARRGGITVRADRMTYYADDDQVVAIGNVTVTREGNVFTGPRLQLKVDANIGYFDQPSYRLGLYRGLGTADRIEFLGEKQYRLSNATFTTCEPNSPAWRVFARELEIDERAETGVARGARLVFGNTGLLALPVLPFAIGDARKSGALAPSLYFGSRSGVELVAPYYFNLAPNRDLTVETHLSARRGLSFSNQFRYLEKPMFGEARLDYTFNDTNTGTRRYYLQTQNTVVNWLGWSGALNARGVSDDSYLSTYSRNILEAAQTKLPRELVLNRSVADGWNTTFVARAYQNLLTSRDSLTETPFDQIPKLSIGKTYRFWNGFEFKQDFEGAQFRRQVAQTALGWRAYSNSSLTYPFQSSAAFVIPKLSFNVARYELDSNPGFSTRFNRAMPTASLDAGLVFERDAAWRGRDLTQTLEPRLFYARAPYRDQTGIPVFDTTAASFGFTQLFSESPYLGQDRIADVNQLSLGVTTRLIEKDGVESLRASLGQRFYFADQRVSLPSGVAIAGRKSDVLMSLGTELVKSLTLDAYAQYTTDTRRLPRFTVNLQYKPDEKRLLNLGVRYLKDPRDLQNQLAQVDGSVRWPVTAQFTALARLNYSFLDTVLPSGTSERPGVVEALAGFELDWDCWVGRVFAHRFVASDKKSNTQFFFQLELKGLGRLGNNPSDVLRRSVPGYRLPSERPTLPSNYFGYN
jgi:LPS-assembly protein